MTFGTGREKELSQLTNLSFLNPKTFTRLSEVHGLDRGSRIGNPRPEIKQKLISDLDPGVQIAPDPGSVSAILIETTDPILTAAGIKQESREIKKSIGGTD